MIKPNSVIQGNGFYISYNNIDIGIYGCDTTALVIGNMEKFLILNGDFRKQYMQIINNGLDECIAFFKANIEHINEYSETMED
jgi:hypothetical protein